jgi:hypothetical protein
LKLALTTIPQPYFVFFPLAVGSSVIPQGMASGYPFRWYHQTFLYNTLCYLYIVLMLCAISS